MLILVDLLYTLFEVIVKMFFNLNFNFILNPCIMLPCYVFLNWFIFCESLYEILKLSVK